MLELGLKFTVAYLLGSLLGSMIMGHLHGGVDIRNVGSRNPGGTNALRTQGKWFALGVMIIDVGKGIACVVILPELALPGIGLDAAVNRELLTYAVAFASVLGHIYPVWFDFRGGKGGATAAGVLCVIAPVLAVVIILFWLGVIFVTGYVGLATMSAAVGAALYIGITGLPEGHALFLFASLLAALIVYTHRSNIQRMREGSETRFGQIRWRRRTEERS